MSDKNEQAHDPLAWWREARFGMFIHWGLYALPAGEWQGKPSPGLGEWIMHNVHIPIAEYEKLAQSFNPVRFDARAWARLAKRAGMKYLVITAKHHDGFTMFHSPSNGYNIVDATPFGRDVMQELAAACHDEGIRLCFYYSQAQDWHAPGGAGHWEEADGAQWYDQQTEPEAFARYLEEKVKPQLAELLTQYGSIGLIWFDTPVVITAEQSMMLKEWVHSLQPDCLVSGRVGHDVGDYGSLGDNQIPRGPLEGDWETPATLNDTWGYRKDDHHWKSTRDLLTLLTDLASKGVNYLLNVGPTAMGEIPEESIRRLEEIGAWMDVNGEAIYGASASPYPYEFEWGRMTTKGNRLYLIFSSWPRQFSLAGLRTPVRRAYLLADPSQSLPFTEEHDAATDAHLLRLSLPETAPDPNFSVLALELEGEPDVDPVPCQQPGGRVVLPAYLSERHAAGADTLALNRQRVLTGWQDRESRLAWTFKTSAPGEFQVRVVVGTQWHEHKPALAHTVRVQVADQTMSGSLEGAEPTDDPRARYFPEYAAVVGKVRLDHPGTYTLQLQAEQIADAPEGLMVAAV
ncbi:MAG TPA: alpha-L-fucosidase, partial [Armatimonadota bacterium]|nr:alpha-L-fucosidase [Armatimonadota bacterium]